MLRNPTARPLRSRAITPLLATATLVAQVMTAACSSAEPNDAGTTNTERDSAGVTIVDVNSDPWNAPIWAVVDTANVVRIRAIDSIPATQFSHLMWVDVLSDGSMVTLDWRTRVVGVFASDGSFLRTIGRSGQGPGEFEAPLVVDVGPGFAPKGPPAH